MNFSIFEQDNGDTGGLASLVLLKPTTQDFLRSSTGSIKKDYGNDEDNLLKEIVKDGEKKLLRYTLGGNHR